MNQNYAWEVPKYEVNFTTDKTQKYAVVIPVINEGQRIINLLTRMNDLRIFEFADVIIVDGGSKDGSLEENRLKSLNVHSLITKRDTGKLSSQLRCAYAFVLEHGYTGVVTIDGNNKDDPKDIGKFIELLKQNYDFIQASRYLSGGFEENTPFIRTFAIRLIHAPLLSLASGFKWTDTTQGFRGYSSKLLLSDRIRIFRSCFQSYELLAYLSYKAPRENFRCVETGTSRVYPEGEVPTKISALKGNYLVFKTLLQVIFGNYDPQ